MTKHTYTGDEADYGVEIVKSLGNAAQVRIVEHDSAACTIPVGVVVTVPTERVL